MLFNQKQKIALFTFLHVAFKPGHDIFTDVDDSRRLVIEWHRAGLALSLPHCIEKTPRRKKLNFRKGSAVQNGVRNGSINAAGSNGSALTTVQLIDKIFDFKRIDLRRISKDLKYQKNLKMSRKEALSQFINQIHGRAVVVKLNSGVDYRGLFATFLAASFVYIFFNSFNVIVSGVLACLDGYMNIALDQTEEYQNGQLKNKYGDAFIRGNNVLYISTQKIRRT